MKDQSSSGGKVEQVTLEDEGKKKEWHKPKEWSRPVVRTLGKPAFSIIESTSTGPS